MIGEVGDELDGIELGASVGSSLDDLEGEDDRESGDLCGDAVDGPDADATGDFDGVRADLCGDVVDGPDADDLCGAAVDGDAVGDPDRDFNGDLDVEDGVAVGDPGRGIGDFVGPPVGAVDGFEEGLTGACVGSLVAAFTSPRERNAVSILP